MTSETYLKFLSVGCILGGLVIAVFTFYLMIEPAIRSDEKQAEIEQKIIEAEKERKERLRLKYVAEGLELANDIVYVQDTRTGICFATEGVQGWHGHFTSVDCEMIPNEMLHKTESKAQ